MKEFRNRILSVLSVCLWTAVLGEAEDDYKNFQRNVSAETQTDAVRQLLQRLIPDKVDQFEIEVDFELNEGNDSFQIYSRNDKVVIKGNKGYSAAAGVYYYLKFFCNCHVSWSGRQLNLPEYLIRPNTTHTVRFNDKYRYYQNVCTSSYSYVWWKWQRWEQEIDWMALNGINLPLAMNGQEAIFKKVFTSLNFTQHEIDTFFTGPAFLAWNRMGNIQNWVGPLTENWHEIQAALQHQILDRMRSFGMTPILPAFSGRVIPAFNKLFPNSSTTYLNKSWGHFQSPYTYVTFLEPVDPMFQEIGSMFLKSYIEEFGSDHFYTADLFNEMPPPSNDTSYLEACSRNLYKSLIAVDPEAIWVTQGWMFFSDEDIWQPPQAKAFLRAVPLGRMLVLDLQSEMYPQYKRLSSYYGQPFIWCMLHNYGGVNGLYASLESVNNGVFEGRNFEGSTMVGMGLTPEGIETNDIAYDLMNELAFTQQPVDLQTWMDFFAICRYGSNSSIISNSMEYLSRSVYNAVAPFRNHGKYILILRPSLKLKPYIWYDPKDVISAWGLFLNASHDVHVSKSSLYKHDLVDLTRQSLQLAMDWYYAGYVKAYRQKNLNATRKMSRIILTLYDDVNEILSSDEHFLLGRWLSDAKDLASTPLERRQYEYNARNQITLWGPSGEILDYANKQWAGLMTAYYKRRWELFFDTIDGCLVNNIPFKQSDFNKNVLDKVERNFNMGTEVYPTQSEGDPIEISHRLYQKYRNLRNRISRYSQRVRSTINQTTRITQ